jgi:hypothetical protein
MLAGIAASSTADIDSGSLAWSDPKLNWEAVRLYLLPTASATIAGLLPGADVEFSDQRIIAKRGAIKQTPCY